MSLRLDFHDTCVSIGARHLRRALAGTAICALAVAFAAPVLAAGDAAAESGKAETAKAKSETDKIEEVVITANKTPENLLKSVGAISAFSADDMKTRGVQSLSDVAHYTPSLTIGRYGVGNTDEAAVFIRGMGLQDHLITTDPSVGVYLDGVYLGRQMGNNLSLENIERVEVLRGPQGTLYGRNSLGGAVNIITRKPGSGAGTTIDLQTGTRGRVNVGFYTDKQLFPDLAVSVEGNYNRRNGVGTALNISNPSSKIGQINEASGRIDVLWTPLSKLTVEATLDGVDDNNGQSPYRADLLTTAQLFEITGSTVPFGPSLNPAHQARSADDSATTVAGLEQTGTKLWGTSLTVDYAFNDAISLKSLTSYRRVKYHAGLNDDDSTDTLSAFPETGDAREFSTELQLNAHFDRINLVSGLYYFDENGRNDSGPYFFKPFDFGGPGDFFHIGQKTRSYAGYAHASYDITSRLTFAVGGRYSIDVKDAHALFPGFASTALRHNKWHALTGDANISYKLTEDSSAYFQVQRGYQPGQYTPRPFGGASTFIHSLKTTAVNYEVGYKGLVLPNWSVRAATFWTQYTDLNFQFAAPDQSGFTTSTAVGPARARGVEVETTFDYKGFTYDGSFSYLDATVLNDVVNPIDGSFEAKAGNRLALTSKYSVSNVVGYRWDLSNGGALTAQATHSYHSSTFGQTFNVQAEKIPGYNLFGFNVRYDNPTGDWSLSAYGNNVFNKVYDEGRLNDSFHNFVGVVLSNDRSEFGLRFTQHFN